MPKIYTQNIPCETRCPPRTVAALVLGIFALSLLLPTPLIASAWNPTLIVNTEAFQTVHEGDSTADVELRFGDTLSEKIYWDRTNAEFRFSDDLRVDGNITASGTLTVSGNAKTKGDLTINSDNGAANAVLTFGNDDTAQTLTYIDAAQKFSFSKDLRVLGNLSGSTLNVDGNAGIYGQLTVSGATTLKSTLKIGGVTYTFPTSDGSASGKVLKTNSAGQLSWSGDNNSGGLSYADAKSYFVDDSGDSMTGALLIQTKTNGAAATADAGVQLEIVGVASGSVLYASSGINSSGAVIIKTPVTTSATLGGTGALVVMQRIELGTGAYISASGAAILALDSPVRSAGLNGQASTTPHIVFGYRGAFDTNLYRLTGSTLATDDALRVGGTLSTQGTFSGAVLKVMAGANSYILGNTGIGTAAPETKLEVVGAISGSSLQVTGNITMSGTIFNALPLSTVEGRLTLTSGTPATTSDVTAAGTLYFTPYKGNRVYLYDGTRWKLYSFNELSTDLSSIIPGGIVSGKNYDIFLQDGGGGALTLSASSAWTNDTTRASALALQNGVYVNGTDSTIRYLGTIRASANNVTEDSATKRFVWNYYNRVERKLFKAFADQSHTYGTATWRSWNASTSERVEIVIGVAELLIEIHAGALVSNTNANEYGAVGIDVDGTSTNDADIVDISITADTNYNTTESVLKQYPAVGYHFYQATEYASAATTVTFYGTFSDATLRRHGILGKIDG